MLDSLSMFESPIQWMIVLLIALIVFGPKRLPEIGRQIGSALRELKKAGSEVVNSFNVDHEPDPHPSYNGAAQYERAEAYTYPPAISAPPDLTDYTIAGLPPKDAEPHDSTTQNLTDYTIARAPNGNPPGTSGEAQTNSEAAKSESAPDAATSGASVHSKKESEQNV